LAVAVIADPCCNGMRNPAKGDNRHSVAFASAKTPEACRLSGVFLLERISKTKNGQDLQD
jgi:hypothetical protein